MKTIKSIFLLAYIPFLISCQENENSFIKNADLLAGKNDIGRSYSIVSAEIDLIEVNGTLILDECITDNTIIYYPNGRYEENEGRSKCSIDDPPGILGTWILTNDDSQILVTVNGLTEVWTIVSINSSGHKLTRATNDGEVTFVLERL